MGLIEKINDFFKIKNETTTFTLKDESIYDFLGIVPDEMDVSGLSALQEATVYACFRILTESVGKLPLKIYKDSRKVSDHYLSPLIKMRPNPLMSAIDFLKVMEFQRLLTGNAFAYIERDHNGRVTGLYPIKSDGFQLLVDDKKITKKNLWYIHPEKNIKIKSEDMIHIKAMSADGLVGLSPIEYLSGTIKNAKSGQDYITKFFTSGMQSKGIIHYTGDLNEDAEANFINKFEAMSNGLNNAHKVSLLPLGFQYESIKQKLTDAQFDETMNTTVRKISAAFGVKMHQLNELSRATHSNISEQQKEFYILTLQPILISYEQEFSYKLLGRSDLTSYYLKFNVDAILRADIKTRFDAYHKSIQSGFKTPNEVRALEDDEPLPGGSRLYMNGNMIAIEDIGGGENN